MFVGHNDPDLPELRRDTDDELRCWRCSTAHSGCTRPAVSARVDADVRDGETRAWRLRTTSFPAADVPMVVAGDPADMPGLVLDMGRLGSSDLQPDDLVRAL